MKIAVLAFAEYRAAVARWLPGHEVTDGSDGTADLWLIDVDALPADLPAKAIVMVMENFDVLQQHRLAWTRQAWQVISMPLTQSVLLARLSELGIDLAAVDDVV